MFSAVGIVTFVTIVLHQSDYEQYLWISIMIRMAWITVSKESFPLWQNEKKWYLAKLYFFDMIVNPILCVVIFDIGGMFLLKTEKWWFPFHHHIDYLPLHSISWDFRCTKRCPWNWKGSIHVASEKYELVSDNWDDLPIRILYDDLRIVWIYFIQKQ